MVGRRVQVPRERIERWVDNFASRHGTTTYAVVDGGLTGRGSDGSSFTARLPFATSYVGPPTAEGLAAVVTAPDDWGVLLVRRGGFAVARLSGPTLVASKVGSRHVQGRTAAGGQSQQRFARRRDNQARQAHEAAADHAARVLDGLGAAHGPVVGGGDRPGVTAVLSDPRLTGLELVEPWLPVPDPRRAVLEAAVLEAQAVDVTVVNA